MLALFGQDLGVLALGSLNARGIRSGFGGISTWKSKSWGGFGQDLVVLAFESPNAGFIRTGFGGISTWEAESWGDSDRTWWD